jgi:hypothetical protein
MPDFRGMLANAKPMMQQALANPSVKGALQRGAGGLAVGAGVGAVNHALSDDPNASLVGDMAGGALKGGVIGTAMPMIHQGMGSILGAQQQYNAGAPGAGGLGPHMPANQQTVDAQFRHASYNEGKFAALQMLGIKVADMSDEYG